MISFLECELEAKPFLDRVPGLPKPLSYIKENLIVLLGGKFQFSERIGQGLNMVFRMNTKEKACDIAVKAYKPKSVGKSMIDEAISEASAIRLCKHPNVCELIHFTLGEQPYLFLKFYEVGSLFDLLHSINLRHNANIRAELIEKLQNSVFRLASGIAAGMQYIHAQKYVHFDLNSKNVLLDQNWNPHISDFGLSERVESFPALFPNKVNTGTSQWMAPELWKKSTKELQKFANYTGPITEKVDVYSYGIILWELNHLGEVLWDGKTANNDIRLAVLTGNFYLSV